MNTSTIAPFNPLHRPAGNAFLCFQLNEQTQALLPMNQIHEVVTLPLDQVALMPNMPACVLGLLSRRSRVLWVVDTAHLLLNQSLAASFVHYEIIVLRINARLRQQVTPLTISHPHVLLGLAVQKIKGSRYVPPEAIQTSPDRTSSSLNACLKGYWFQQNTFMSILDAEAIGRLPTLQVNH